MAAPFLETNGAGRGRFLKRQHRFWKRHESEAAVTGHQNCFWKRKPFLKTAENDGLVLKPVQNDGLVLKTSPKMMGWF
jgi:hypothetical protein